MGCGASSHAAAPGEKVHTAPGEKALPPPVDKPVMISYRVADTGTRDKGGDGSASRIHETLVRAGYTVLMDTDLLEGGDDWRQVIQDAVERCYVFLAICSPGYCSDESQFTLKEFFLAESLKKAIIPVWHSGAWPPPKLKLSLITTNYVPKSMPLRDSNFETAMTELLTAVGRKFRNNGEPAAAAGAVPVQLRAPEPAPKLSPATTPEQNQHAYDNLLALYKIRYRTSRKGSSAMEMLPKHLADPSQAGRLMADRIETFAERLCGDWDAQREAELRPLFERMQAECEGQGQYGDVRVANMRQALMYALHPLGASAFPTIPPAVV